MVKYEDAQKLYISADFMVFIGKNLEDSVQDRDSWYFQASHSFCFQGPLVLAGEALDWTDLPEPSDDHHWNDAEAVSLYVLHEEDVDQMVGFERFSVLLAECHARRTAAGMAA